MKKYASLAIKSGKPPGSVVYIGEKKREDVTIKVIQYNEEVIHQTDVSLLELSHMRFLPDYNWWIVVDGMHDVEVIKGIGNLFQINPVSLENIVNTAIRPSLDVYKNYAMIVSKKLDFDNVQEIDAEQIALVIGSNYLLTFTENGLEQAEILYRRLEEVAFRKKDVNYLTYLILDSIVDQYFVVMEKIGDFLEEIETQIMEKPSKDTVERVYRLKKELLIIQKMVWPQREIINSLIRDKDILHIADISEYYRDLYDNLFQVIDMVEIQRDMLSGLLDMYLSSTSRRMNEIMNVLTIISTVFMPLTLIAGIYGMNFQNMPELRTQNGYFVVLAIMIGISVAMLSFFKYKKWF